MRFILPVILSKIANCGFLDLHIMNGDIIIDMKVGNSISNWTRRAIDQETSSNPTCGGQIIMMETNPQEITDPENTKLQYIVDSLQQEFNQRSCQNRNNLLLLTEWMSINNPTLAANLLLQRKDIIAKRVDGKLLVAPCKFKGLKSKVIEFKREIINKFELERINAELEILSKKQDTTNPGYNQFEKEILWEQISQQGEELAEQLETEVGKATELIQEELSEFVTHWRLIIISASIFIVFLIFIVVKLKIELIQSICCSTCTKPSNHREVVTIPTVTRRTFLLDKEDQHNSTQGSKGTEPLIYVPCFLPPERVQPLQSGMSEQLKTGKKFPCNAN